MGKIKSAIDKLSGTESSSRTAGAAIEKLGNIEADAITTDKITIGSTELDEEKLTALLALLD